MSLSRFLQPILVLVLFFLTVGWTVHPNAEKKKKVYTIAFDQEQVKNTGPVYVVPVKGTIDKGLAKSVVRATKEAAAKDAAIIVFRIDTFGGLISAADKIRKTILNASVPTVAFIDKNAASAGALISYAADRIVMVPGASMGAATAVQGGSGQKASEKVQSYTRGLMRSTAEANGRDPRIAEAMVDESIAIDGVIERGRLLTLSASEAVDIGVSEALYSSLDQLREGLELKDRKLVFHTATSVEQALRFFGGSVIQSILMLAMMGGFYFELQTPGMGFPGATAAIAALLFFAPNYVLGFVTGWEIVLFIIGLLLLILEVFVFPGFGVAGFGGIVLTVGALLASLVGNVGFSFPSGPGLTSAIVTMSVTLILLLVLIVSFTRYMPRSKRLNGLVLAPELTSASGYTSAVTNERLVGKLGKAFTALRPAGTAEVDGQRVDVVTQGEFVARGERVQVMKVQGSRVVVTLADETKESQETS